MVRISGTIIEIAGLMRSRKADYILGLKGNQGTLLAEVKNFFTQVISMDKEEWEEECECDYFLSEEQSRNRQEKRFNNKSLLI